MKQTRSTIIKNRITKEIVLNLFLYLKSKRICLLARLRIVHLLSHLQDRLKQKSQLSRQPKLCKQPRFPKLKLLVVRNLCSVILRISS